MIKVIKEQKKINAFLLVFNGQNIRWNQATWQILTLFDQMFPQFWKNVIIVVNFFP